MGVIKFKYDVPLDQTMAFEAVYHENLQLDLAEKEEIREIPGSIFVWMFIDGELVGESYGSPLLACDEPDEPIEGLAGLTEDEKKTGICTAMLVPEVVRRPTSGLVPYFSTASPIGTAPERNTSCTAWRSK